MRTWHYGLALAAVALSGAVAYALTKPDDDAPAPAGGVALDPPTPATAAPSGTSLGVPVSDDPPGRAAAGVAVVEDDGLPVSQSSGAKEIIKLAASAAGAGPVATLGFLATEATATALAIAGSNQASIDATRVMGWQVGLGALANKGIVDLGKKVGVPEEAAKGVGLAAGVGVVAGAYVGVVAGAAKAAGEGISWAVGEVLGEGAEKDLRNAVSQLDPFKPGSGANKVVGAIAGFIYGGPSGPPTIRSVSEEEKRAIVKAEAQRATTYNRKLGQGNLDDV